MASDNETVEDIVSEMNCSHEGMIAFEFQHYASRIEAAHRREIAAKDAEIAELRECLMEACDVACDGCRHAVWNDGKIANCKRHKNWKCPFGAERWRKALEGAKNEKDNP